MNELISLVVSAIEPSLVPPIFAEAAAKFWSHVQRGPGCWFWKGGKRSTDGYGMFRVPLDTPYGRGWIVVSSHKVAYTLVKGPIPPGKILLHSCDMPACVNPDHLTPGTRRDNSQEAVARGRMNTMPRKFSAETAEEIRNLYFVANMTVSALAKRHGVSKPAVIELLTGRTHRAAPGPVGPIRKTVGRAVYGAKLTEQKVAELRARFLRGETIHELAPVFGIAFQTVSKIIRNETWRHVAPMPSVQIRPGHKKLTKEQVTKIRQRHAAGTPQARLADDYSVSGGAIS
mgnify:CR=1 FL=1